MGSGKLGKQFALASDGGGFATTTNSNSRYGLIQLVTQVCRWVVAIQAI